MNSFVDFLGQKVRVGDDVIFTNKDRGGELVLGELLDLISKEGRRWELDQDNKYISVTCTYYIPVIQPLKSPNSRRFQEYSEGKVVPKVARKVRLSDTNSVMLFNPAPMNVDFPDD